MLRSRHLLAAVALFSLGAVACSDDQQPASPTAAPELLSARSTTGRPTDYYILMLPQGAGAPSTLAADVAAAGGTLKKVLPELGLAIAESKSAGFEAKAAKLRGVQDAVRDVEVQWTDPNQQVVEAGEAAPVVGADAPFGLNETFSNVQWAPQAVHAPEAWAAGYLGAGARVAVLDGGIYTSHIDLVGRVDLAHSASFYPGKAYDTDVGTLWHGTHVAGIIAASINNIGTTGIAPQATIIGVKVLDNGSGSFEHVINGIVYAATPIANGGGGAHIINMSLGAEFPRQGNEGTVKLAMALSRATQWARQQGVLVIASAGNDAIDLDHTANLVSVPAQSTGVVAISALGPLNWGADPSVDLDRPASYTNFGQSAITLAGPGGDFVLPGSAVCSRPRLPSGTVLQLCWALDMVLSTSRGTGASVSSYTWAAGTSMAAPAVAGVAALIVGKYGPMAPAQLEARLRQTADDLGKPGNDDFYGRGRVNALRAVTE